MLISVNVFDMMSALLLPHFLLIVLVIFLFWGGGVLTTVATLRLNLRFGKCQILFTNVWKIHLPINECVCVCVGGIVGKEE